MSEAQTPDKYTNLIHKRKQEGLIPEDAVCKGKWRRPNKEQFVQFQQDRDFENLAFAFGENNAPLLL